MGSETDAPTSTPALTPAPLLTYSTEPAFRVTARHVRWGIVWFGAFLVFTGFVLNPLLELSNRIGVGIYGTPLAPFDLFGQSDREVVAVYGIEVAGYAGLFVLTQALFLLPRGGLAFRASEGGRPLWRAAAGAAFAGMLLTVGLAAAVMEWTGAWRAVSDAGPYGGSQQFWPVWLAMLALWLAWAAVFHHFWRNLDHRTAVSRTTRALLAGTVLELLVAVPIHAWTQRKGDDCYCARGSYTALVFGGTVLLWLFGPGIVMLAMRERRRGVRKA